MSIAQQIVQSYHAIFECGQECETDAPSIALCKCKTEGDLLLATEWLDYHGIKYKLFREPDFGNAATALATVPVLQQQRKIFKKWKLYDIDKKT